MPAKQKIKEMFDSIAADYDSLNHLLSLDVDKSWRRRALKQIVPSNHEAGPIEVLDIACGTGDFSIAIAKALEKGHVTGIDLSEGMLEVMKEKVEKAGVEGKITIEEGDGENLRFADNSFDRVTNAFGIRNFEDRDKGLREALRVLRSGGKLVILELSRPEGRFLRSLYDLYFLRILPKVGGKVSGDKAAYAYLPASVKGFPDKKTFMKMMSDAGFSGVAHKSFTFGICRMYTGTKT